jgi:hypothetical protein
VQELPPFSSFDCSRWILCSSNKSLRCWSVLIAVHQVPLLREDPLEWSYWGSQCVRRAGIEGAWASTGERRRGSSNRTECVLKKLKRCK